MVSITVHLNFDYALFFIFCPLWQALIENGARSQLSVLFLSVVWLQLLKLIQNRSEITAQFGFEIVLKRLPD